MSGLEEMIDSFQKLADGSFDEEIAREAAPELEEALKVSAGAGVDPEGKAWAAKKDGGGRAMPKAAKAIAVKAFGAVIRVTLTGVEVFHHFGKGATEVRRRIIPDAGGAMPELVARVLEKARDRVFARMVGGAR